MIVTIDSNTQPVELYHLSILFQSLAKAHGFVAPVEARTTASQTNTVGEMSVTLNVDTTDATSAVEALADLIDRTGVKVEDVPPVTVSTDGSVVTAVMPPIRLDGAVHSVNVQIDIEPPVTNDKLDADGLPWDARIHSGSRERNANGKWRTARKPKALTEEQWQETLTRVNAELRDLMEIPVSTGAVADAAVEEALTDDEVDEFADIVAGIGADDTIERPLVNEPVVVAPPVTIAPPVVVPPVTAVAPPITVTIETFAQLMSWLTSRTPKDEAAKPAMVTRVNEILAANGLTTLQQLGQRADLIPQVLVQFQAAFGE
jgi:hypothetical protein